MMMTDGWATELRREMNGQILLGHDVASGHGHSIYLRDLKETSAHILGASGYGKSYFLRGLIGEFIRQRQPFGLIDPHRELADYALWRLRRAGVPPKKIVLIDPGDSKYATAFNPLSCGITDPGEA